MSDQGNTFDSMTITVNGTAYNVFNICKHLRKFELSSSQLLKGECCGRIEMHERLCDSPYEEAITLKCIGSGICFGIKPIGENNEEKG